MNGLRRVLVSRPRRRSRDDNITLLRLVLLAVLTFCTGARTQIIIDGKCQDVTIEQKFKVNEYLGLWYENKKYPNFFELDGKCNSATYSLNPNGTVKVFNSQVDTRSTGVVTSIEGWAQLDNLTTGEGKLTVHFPSVGSVGQYWVLSTDYTGYSVVWSCSQITPSKTIQFGWVLTRARSPDVETLAKAQEVIGANRLANKFVGTDQTGCPTARIQGAQAVTRRTQRRKTNTHHRL